MLEAPGRLDPPEMTDSPEPLAPPDFVETMALLEVLEPTV